jgi:hypothetical protein
MECFYHTVDAPLIPILQAHYLRDAIIEKKLNGTTDLFQDVPGKRTNFDLLYAEVCYPDYPIDTFQVGKMLGTRNRDSDNWIAKHNPRYHQGWQWAYDQYFAGLDDSLVKKNNGEVIGLLAYESENYLVDPNFGTNLGDYYWKRT